MSTTEPKAAQFQKRLDPELASALEMFPPFQLDDIHQARKYMQVALESLNENAATSNNLVTIQDISIDCEQPRRKLRLRTYRTRGAIGNLPLVFYLHGGGMVLSSPEGEDSQCIEYANAVNCVVVSVDYRLAPEHPYPAALNDCYEALQWAVANACTLGIDRDRIAVVGASAGGGLTAALVMKARDFGGPPISLQLPLYPMLDHRNHARSEWEVAEQRIWNRKINGQAWSMYLGHLKEHELTPYATQAKAVDFSDLPRCYFFVGELDIFLEESINHARNLLRAGVATEFIVYPGCFHGFESLVPHANVSKRARVGVTQALIRELHGKAHTSQNDNL